MIPFVTSLPTPGSEQAGGPQGSRPSPLAELLRTYSYAYTAAHDFSVSDRIMIDDYVLLMGDHLIRGRKEEYQPATQRQYDQFPALGFTVHRLVCNGERASLHFTEHGRSRLTGGLAAWQGVSLYRWDGERLTQCRVEQDYHSRRMQLAAGVPVPVLPPAADPWSGGDTAADPRTCSCVRAWLESNAWLADPGPARDDGSAAPRFAEPSTEILDLFSAGTEAAFHVRLTGTYAGGLPGTGELTGRRASLYVAGIVDTTQVADHRQASAARQGADSSLPGVLISDRHGMLRRLRAG